MELKKAQLIELKEKVSNGSSIEQVLAQEFPDVRITVIQGRTQILEEDYVQDALFNTEKARKVMKRIKPEDRDRPDTFSLKKYNLTEVNNLELLDKMRVYRFLGERLNLINF